MKAAKTVFLCSNCGNETPRWQGRCPSCGQWNTLEEYTPPQAAAPSRSSLSNRTSAARGVGVQPKRLNEVTSGEELRFGTGLSELDRVLGGGAVRGSLVLVSGAPGIGKSTLLLQICAQICREQTILYVSGEESENQLKLRAERLGVQSDALWLLCETSLDEILAAAERMQPGLLIVDSIQTLYTEDKTSSPGSIAQVRDCTMRLMQYSKRCGVTVFVVGHINKEGAIAGPKVLEHMVDCVLYFEGEEHTTYRLLRAAKNRFGSTNEIGVFEMDDRGLREVPNPSELLLAGRPLGTPGTCVACVMEGTRPVLAEVQALVCQTTYNMPRRTSNGYDYNRAAMLLAVLEKRGGLRFGSADVYLNVIGGLRLDEPAADLAVAIAVRRAGQACARYARRHRRGRPDRRDPCRQPAQSAPVRAAPARLHALPHPAQRHAEPARTGGAGAAAGAQYSRGHGCRALSRVEYACIRSGGVVLPERFFGQKRRDMRRGSRETVKITVDFF